MSSIIKSFSLNTKTNADIIEFLNGRDVSSTVREALQAMMGQPSISDVIRKLDRLEKQINSGVINDTTNEDPELSAALDSLLGV